MVKGNRKPELIVIAGSNGSGKTSVTRKFLYHEYSDDTVYINPDPWQALYTAIFH
ncbi:zeta toxin family protein [Bacteroides sp. AN502(2024)]|uniref:zeta toxin family protein n=1 Tax=Bacteroides sp. AN502(2024) TaxID=3160599 RepID=UPI003513DA8A